MEKSKKISFTSIAIVVLAILLTVSLTMGGTLAWFANQNQAGTTLTMGNAVGVAVVDNAGNGSMDRLSFQFNTGRNGELMLPGTQIDPDVRALVAKSNTNTILRAVVTFEVTVHEDVYSDKLIAANATLAGENKTKLETASGTALIPASYYDSDDDTGRYYMNVPSLVADDAAEAAFGSAERELYLLNQMYKSFFANLQNSALYNGWVYRESNYNAAGNPDKVVAGSAKLASTSYYIAGATQYSNTPLPIGRNAGPNRTQPQSSAGNAATDAVAYNAFYFRGWASNGGQKTGEAALTGAGLTAGDAYAAANGNGWKVEDRGIDGTYVVQYSRGSKTGSELYVPGTGRQYHYLRSAAHAAAGTAEQGEYAILEGTFAPATAQFTRVADNLGYKVGDYTANAATTADYKAINVATETTNARTQEALGSYVKTNDGWITGGVQEGREDMMCVLNTISSTARVPLFTTSFVLPTTWTQDAFADRSIRLNITFQVMQSDYLASGSSHHVSVELAESRFDDATIWPTAPGTSATGTTYVANQPYVKDVNNQPDFNNPLFWNQDPYEYDDSLSGGGK